MATVSIELPADLVEKLKNSFDAGPIIDDQGRRQLNEEEVGRINAKMVVMINADEHPPPHFHVKFDGENASFNLATGKRLRNIKGLERFDRNISKWWKANFCDLIKVWNSSRPTGCQVGPMPVPDECKSEKT